MNGTTFDEIDVLQNLSRLFYGWFSSSIFVLGTVGNLADIILFVRLEHLNRLASSLFLLGSFVGSEFVMLTATLFRLIYGLTNVDLLNSSLFLCKYRWMVGPASGAFSLTCVSLAGIDRYIMVRSQYRLQIQLNQARLLIVTACLFWLGFFSIYAVYFIAPTPGSCRLVDPIVIQMMPFISLFVYSIIPISGLTLISFLIWHKLGQLPQTYIHGGRRLRDDVTRMIISQIIVIIITSAPNAIFSLYTISTRTVIKNAYRSALENVFNTVCVLIGFLTHAIMFYIYLLASSQFRKNAHITVKLFYQWLRRSFLRLGFPRQPIHPVQQEQ